MVEVETLGMYKGNERRYWKLAEAEVPIDGELTFPSVTTSPDVNRLARYTVFSQEPASILHTTESNRLKTTTKPMPLTESSTTAQSK